MAEGVMNTTFEEMDIERKIVQEELSRTVNNPES